MRLPNSRPFRLHLIATMSLAVFMIVLNLLADRHTFWSIWTIWALSIPLGIHAGFAWLRTHRLLGMWLGVSTVVIVGLIVIDLANPGTPWWFWPTGAWMVITALFVGLSVDLLSMVPGVESTPPDEE